MKRPTRRRCVATCESLEPRQVLSTGSFSLVSGQTRLLSDGDGSTLIVQLEGPGSGTLRFADDGQLGAITLRDTTGQSRLRISSLGGTTTGTELDQLDILKAPGARSSLGMLIAPSIRLADGARVQANGNVGSMTLGPIGDDVAIEIAGRLGRLDASAIGHAFDLHATGDLARFRAGSLGPGAFLNIEGGITRFEVVGLVQYASVQTGPRGLVRLDVGSLFQTTIASAGGIGHALVRGDMRASSITARVIPGFDNAFGSGDDATFGSLTSIKSVVVEGQLAGSPTPGQTYGILVNGDLGPVFVGGRQIAGPARPGRSDDGRVLVAGAPFPDVAGDDLPDYAIADFMNWGANAPDYSASNVAYTSSGIWQNLKIINYEPAHYPNIDNDGTLHFLVNNQRGATLDDTTFQDNLATDLPDAAAKGVFISYLQGNPQITVYNDLRQLQHAGFDGVRLYASPPHVYVRTIQAAKQLSEDTGKPFYVAYEVAAPNLAEKYISGTVAERIQGLYTDHTRINPPEGSFQALHYVINTVTPEVFSQVVPLVFYTHENLVSPDGNTDQKMTDDNSSVALLRWGINAVRDILKKELDGQPQLPAVTTALLAGHVIQVSLDIHPAVDTLISVIQADPNSPIAYDVYPFQWANRYYNTAHDHINDGKNIIDNAYPVDPVTGAIAYTDRTEYQQDGKTVEWLTGPPPVAPTFSVAATVTGKDPAKPDMPILQWSLQWMTDRVNWLWGHLKNGKDTTPQLIAETGWASAQSYTDKEDHSTPAKAVGRVIQGNMADAKEYFETVSGMGFKVNNAPVMYFSAYDEPVKTSNDHPAMFSENHYGIFSWTGIPKFTADDNLHPLTQPFAILGIAPFMDGGTPQSVQGDKASSPAYSITYTPAGGTARKLYDVPWYWGGTTFSDNVGGRITFMPNPDIFLADGDRITVTPLHPASNSPSTPGAVTYQYNGATRSLSVSPTNIMRLDPPDTSKPVGSKWTQNTSFNWYHPTDEWQNKTLYPRVYQDWWARPRNV